MTASSATARTDAESSDTLVLMNKSMVAVPRARTMILIMLAFALLLLGGVAAILMDNGKQADTGWLDGLTRIWDKLQWQDISNVMHISALPLLQITVLVVAAVYMDWAKRTERLVLSPAGIRYVSAFPGWLKRFAPDWSIAWREVQAVELGFPPFVHQQRRDSAEFVFMTFKGTKEERLIAPMRWINPETYTARDKLREAFRLRLRPGSDADIRKAVSESEVMRYLAARQPQIRTGWNATPKEIMTSLEKNPHARIVLALLALLFVYTFVDLVLCPESYVDAAPAHTNLYIFSGAIAALLSGLWLARSTLKHFEKYALAILLGAAVGFAMIPGALRINQYVGDNPLVTYDCHVIQDKDAIILQPVTPGIPRIEYFANNPYWQRFGKDALYPVRVRKGILGFYQFDSDAIQARMKSGK